MTHLRPVATSPTSTLVRAAALAGVIVTMLLVPWADAQAQGAVSVERDREEAFRLGFEDAFAAGNTAVTPLVAEWPPPFARTDARFWPLFDALTWVRPEPTQVGDCRCRHHALLVDVEVDWEIIWERIDRRDGFELTGYSLQADVSVEVITTWQVAYRCQDGADVVRGRYELEIRTEVAHDRLEVLDTEVIDRKAHVVSAVSGYALGKSMATEALAEALADADDQVRDQLDERATGVCQGGSS